MRPVSDAFLLNVAEVSATLIGLFLVGVFFYVETGFRRLEHAREIFEPYFRASTRIVLILYALPLGLSLTLVVLEPGWNRLLFALLSLMLLAANVDTIVRILPVAKATGSTVLLVNEALGTLAVLTLVSVPWILGGLDPTREDLTWAILLSFGSGFLSVGALVLSVFDTATYERATGVRSGALPACVHDRDREEQPREAGAEAGEDVGEVADAQIEAAEADRRDEQRHGGEPGSAGL